MSTKSSVTSEKATPSPPSGGTSVVDKLPEIPSQELPHQQPPQLITHVVVEQPRPSPSFELYALLPTALTILAAVGGYLLVEHFARKREMRTDLRTIAASFREAVDDIVDDATAFYGEPGGSARARALAVTIRSKIASLSDIILALQSGKVQVEANDELILFRKAVTGGDFEQIARPAMAAGDVRYMSIAGAAQQLQRKVDLSFYNSLIAPKSS